MRNQRQTSGDSSLSQPNIHVHIHTYRVSQKMYLFCATLMYVVFFVIFWKFVILFFGTPVAQKKIREPFFSLKIKSSEKQKCVYKLFLSKSKIFQRLNQRITENSQNCNKKISNF